LGVCSRSETITVYASNGASNVGTHTLYARLWGEKGPRTMHYWTGPWQGWKRGLDVRGREARVHSLLLWNLGTGHPLSRVSEVLVLGTSRRATRQLTELSRPSEVSLHRVEITDTSPGLSANTLPRDTRILYRMQVLYKTSASDRPCDPDPENQDSLMTGPCHALTVHQYMRTYQLLSGCHCY